MRRLVRVCLLLFAAACALASQQIEKWQCRPIQLVRIPSRFFYVTSRNVHVTGFQYPEWMLSDKKYQFVDCSQRGLAQIPPFVKQDVQLLDLSRNQIASVRSTDFCPYRSVVAIDLSENCVQFGFDFSAKLCRQPFIIEAGSFGCLPALKLLELSRNNIKEMPGDLPVSLSVLLASYTIMKPLKAEKIKHLENLEVARFSANCILGDAKNFCPNDFHVEDNAFINTKLGYLDLGYANFTVVPKHVFVPSLLGVRLRGNPICETSRDDFATITKTKFLILCWTSQYDYSPLHIKEHSFDLLVDLQWLNLAGNLLTSLPENIFSKNLKLEHLNLAFNCFMHLSSDPKMVSPLPELTSIVLAGNTRCSDSLWPIVERNKELILGESFRHFPKLKKLRLGAFLGTTWTNKYVRYGVKYNKVSFRSLEVLRNLSSFEELNLAAMGIRTLEANAWAGLNKLRRIDLRINEIGSNCNQLSRSRRSVLNMVRNSTIDDETLGEKSVDVNYLIFRRNEISELNKTMFKYSKMVVRLDLSYNRISYIFNGTFSFMVALEELDLRYNPIREIGADALMGLGRLNTFRLNNTVYQHGLNFTFLQSSYITQTLFLQAGGYFGDLYVLLIRFYLQIGAKFPLITKIDFSGVGVPLYLISRNHPVYSIFPNLLVLKLEYASLRYPLGSNFFSGIGQLRDLDISHCKIQKFPHEALQKLPNLVHLDISHNLITSLKEGDFSNMPKLKILTLSHNFIQHIEPGVFIFFNLSSIDLSSNHIADASPDIIDQNVMSRLDYLDLRGNVLTCTCSMVNNFGWLIFSGEFEKRVLPGFLPNCPPSMFTYYGGCVACRASPMDQLHSVFAYSSSHFCQINFDLVLSLTFTAFVAAFTYIPVILHTRRFKIFLAKSFFGDIRKTDAQESYESLDENVGMTEFYAFHGFLFYDHTDAKLGRWVDDRLLPEMSDGSPPYNLCVHGRDDFCGATQVKQLLLKMECSRKTIILLSDSLIQTPQCKYILSVLEDWIYSTGKDRSVFVSFDDQQCRSLLLQRRCKRNPNVVLQYPSDPDKIEMFWEAMRTALCVSPLLEQ